MSHRIRNGFSLVFAACVALLSPILASAQELVLDAIVEVGANKPELRRYAVTVGKETILETNGIFRIVMVAKPLSSDSFEIQLQMIDAGSNHLSAGTTTKAKLGQKRTLMHVGREGDRARFKIDGTTSLK